ncbi:cupin domain-containing protein [Crossiella sp. NPDC003009]
MYQVVSIEEPMWPSLREMFDELGEPPQVLTRDSPHPLVVHEVMGQLTFVQEGSGFISLDGDERAVKAGDLLILSARCEHAFLSAVDGELVLRHWHWPAALLETDRKILTWDYRFSLPGAAVSAGD